MTAPHEPPPIPPIPKFERDAFLEKPGLVGARWWQDSLAAQDRSMERRSVLKGLLVAGGVVGALGLAGYAISRAVRPKKLPVSLGTRRALDMQKMYGWDFGARGVPLVFDGAVQRLFVRSDLERLGTVLTPAHWQKYYVATLAESLFAEPKQTLPEPADPTHAIDAAQFRPLADVLVPVVTPAMERAYRVGEAFARECDGHSHLAALADMPGQQAVAFAAGACSRFEPVLLFDNWPHPHGVVPSHLALAALAYYQPRFAEEASQRTSNDPLFVVDRGRLNPYSEESDRFDNRYYANMPSLSALADDGVRGLFYVVASSSDLPEPGDLNRTLAMGTSSPGTGGVMVRALALSDFRGDPSDASAPVYYGGSRETDASFWVNYPFDPGFRPRAQRIAQTSTMDHQFVLGATKAPPPANVGKVAVLVTATGLLIGAALDRRGSMNRFSSGWAG